MSDELHAGGLIPEKGIDLNDVSKETYVKALDAASESKEFGLGELSEFNDLFAAFLPSNKKADNTMKHLVTIPFKKYPDVRNIFTNSPTDPVSTERQILDVYCQIDQRNHYSDYSILVAVGIEGEEECNVDISLGKDADKIYALPDKYKDAAPFIIQAVRDHVYAEMNRFIKRAGPAYVSDFFFGNVRIDIPEYGKGSLKAYIISLNDNTDMTREEIANQIDSLMGDDVPRIPVNPMLWLLEDRPVKFVDWPSYIWAHGPDGKDITADKISMGDLVINEIQKPAKMYTVEDLYVKEDSEGKKWFKYTGVLPPDIDTGPVT